MSVTEGPHSTPRAAKRSQTVSRYLFDLRSIIGLLLGIYGIGLILYALVATTPEQIEQAAGLHINLGTGAALLLMAGAFLAWATIRPVQLDWHDEQNQDEKSSVGTAMTGH